MTDSKEEMKFEIEWCQLCHGNMVICPKCGNNCCNGGYGEVDGGKCDVCPLAYQFQELYWKLEKLCTCPKECICEWDEGDFGLPSDRKHNPDCPIHNKLPPVSDCPVHTS